MLLYIIILIVRITTLTNTNTACSVGHISHVISKGIQLLDYVLLSMKIKIKNKLKRMICVVYVTQIYYYKKKT